MPPQKNMGWRKSPSYAINTTPIYVNYLGISLMTIAVAKSNQRIAAVVWLSSVRAISQFRA
jgi:hypothetical protein